MEGKPKQHSSCVTKEVKIVEPGEQSANPVQNFSKLSIYSEISHSQERVRKLQHLISKSGVESELPKESSIEENGYDSLRRFGQNLDNVQIKEMQQQLNHQSQNIKKLTLHNLKLENEISRYQANHSPTSNYQLLLMPSQANLEGASQIQSAQSTHRNSLTAKNSSSKS